MTSHPLILSLETATLGGSVFLGRGTVELAAKTSDPETSHSNSLLNDINSSLAAAGISLADVEVFACAAGPGSFTGLRIGIATLKALAATLRRPCAAIPTLNAIAHAAGASSATVALLPAGRGEVFAQMFSVSNEGAVTALDAAAHLSPSRLIDKYGSISDLVWAGSGAHLQRKLIEDQARNQGTSLNETAAASHARKEIPGWILAPPVTNLAAHVAALALQQFAKGEFQSPETLSAIYVRPSDAELKERAAH